MSITLLYNVYCLWCKANQYNTKSAKNFKADLYQWVGRAGSRWYTIESNETARRLTKDDEWPLAYLNQSALRDLTDFSKSAEKCRPLVYSFNLDDISKSSRDFITCKVYDEIVAEINKTADTVCDEVIIPAYDPHVRKKAPSTMPAVSQFTERQMQQVGDHTPYTGEWNFEQLTKNKDRAAAAIEYADNAMRTLNGYQSNEQDKYKGCYVTLLKLNDYLTQNAKHRGTHRFDSGEYADETIPDYVRSKQGNGIVENVVLVNNDSIQQRIKDLFCN